MREMNNEDAIKMLEYIKHTGNGEGEYKNNAQAIALDMAIKALEQESFLDKIRAEIMKLDDINPDYPMDMTVHISRYAVLQIIDKYKAESGEGSEYGQYGAWSD